MTAAGLTRGTPAYVDHVHVMGTVVVLDVRAPQRPAALDAAVEAAADRLTAVDEMFSPWIHDSWVSRLLRGVVPLEDCPAEVRHVVSLAELLADRTDGWFTPRWRGTAGPDPTGLVKGWAAQQASDVLLAHGLDVHGGHGRRHPLLDPGPGCEAQLGYAGQDPRPDARDHAVPGRPVIDAYAQRDADAVTERHPDPDAHDGPVHGGAEHRAQHCAERGPDADRGRHACGLRLTPGTGVTSGNDPSGGWTGHRNPSPGCPRRAARTPGAAGLSGPDLRFNRPPKSRRANLCDPLAHPRART